MAAASRSGAKKAVKKTATKTTTKSSKQAPPAKKATTKRPVTKPAPKTAAKKTGAKKTATKAASAASKPPAREVRRAQPSAGSPKGTKSARGSGGAQRPPAPAAKTKPAPAEKAPPPPTSTLTEPVDPATLHLTAAPVLHRILTCHVAVGAITRLESTGDSLFTAARNALQSGIRALEHDLTHDAAAANRPTGTEEHPHTRPIAVPAGLAAALLVTRLAEECFHGDVHVAGGWLVARGAGHPVTLPTPGGPATRQTLLGAIHRLAASERAGKGGRSGRSDQSSSKGGAAKAGAKATKTTASPAVVASGARVSAPLILVPAGPQLRAMREALGVTREEVAQVAGLTPDTVGEIERDRRPTAAARLQVAEVLCGMNPATRLAA